MTHEAESVRIRPGRVQDLAAILALDEAVGNAPHWKIEDYAGAVLVDPQETSAVHRSLFVAESSPLILGFSVVKIVAIEGQIEAELETVVVAETSRRLGLGRALCNAAITKAREEAATSISLEVRSRSEAPIGLYRSLGFVSVGRRPGYYRDPLDDALLMRFDLGDVAR